MLCSTCGGSRRIEEMMLTEFISMMFQDNETQSATKKKLNNDVIDCMRVVALQNEPTAEVDNAKTCDGAFKEIESYARKNGNCTGIFAAMEVVAKYLGLKFDKEIMMAPVAKIEKSNVIDLSDFM